MTEAGGDDIVAGVQDGLDITGSSSLDAGGTLKILLEGPTGETKYHYIVWFVRMPMTLTCVCVGASLALAGEQMQTILQNPLASPYTL